jgi:hypothetical protein
MNKGIEAATIDYFSAILETSYFSGDSQNSLLRLAYPTLIFVLFLYIVEIAVVLNITEILLAGR